MRTICVALLVLACVVAIMAMPNPDSVEDVASVEVPSSPESIQSQDVTLEGTQGRKGRFFLFRPVYYGNPYYGNPYYQYPGQVVVGK